MPIIPDADFYPFPALPGGPVTYQQLLYAFRHELRELCICPGPPNHLKMVIPVNDVLALMMTYDLLDYEALQSGARDILILRKPAARELREIDQRKEQA